MVATVDISLNWQQKEAVDYVLGAFERGIKIVGLYGSAGVGKTFSASAILSELDGNILVLAPTNTAVRQLDKSFRKAGKKYNCQTISKALGLVPSIDSDGKTLFAELETEEERENDLENQHFIAIDESSMVPREHLEKILERVRPTTKILILMDKWQLPPVNEREIYAEILVGQNYYELLKTERYREDSYIYQVITASRQAVIDNDKSFNFLRKFPKTVRDSDNEGYLVKNEGDALETLCKSVRYMRSQSQWDYVRCISWRNSEVHRINNIVRHNIFPGLGERVSFLPGELLITTGAVTRPSLRFDGDDVIYPTSTNLVVERATPAIRIDDDGDEWKVWEVTVIDPDQETYGGRYTQFQAIIIDQNHRLKFDAKLANLQKAIAAAKESNGYKSPAWRIALSKYQSFQKTVDPIRCSYAVTAHGCQGMSLDISFTNISDIRKNNYDISVRLRSMFVGSSRARKALVAF